MYKKGEVFPYAFSKAQRPFPQVLLWHTIPIGGYWVVCPPAKFHHGNDTIRTNATVWGHTYILKVGLSSLRVEVGQIHSVASKEEWGEGL